MHAEAEAKPLTCAACGEAFADVKHLKQGQVASHRETRQRRVVCAHCTSLGFTAFSVNPAHVACDEKKGTLKCKTCK